MISPIFRIMVHGLVAETSHRLQQLPTDCLRLRSSRMRPVETRLMSQLSQSERSIEGALRREILLKSLDSLEIDAEQLDQAVVQSMINPTKGYDGRFGKSAIKTYRSFIYPKANSLEMDEIQLQAAARRTSLQIQFLIARHNSHQAAWVRHHDSEQAMDLKNATSVRKFPFIVLLDNLRSAQNVGSLFRTADAAGVEQVITCGITPHPNGNGREKLKKTALGSDSFVSSRHFETTRQGIDYVRETKPGYALIGMETTSRSISYVDHDFTLHSGVCLTLGNEVTGVETDLMPLFDAVLEIPMFGVKNSLNVAACAPIILYEMIRQWTREEVKTHVTESTNGR